MEMKKITLSTPPYSSDDPATDGLRMLPLEEGTSADHNVTDEAPADKPVAKGKKQADESDDEDA